jgi:hypothetical protein
MLAQFTQQQQSEQKERAEKDFLLNFADLKRREF